jgi:hypothetical protein
MRTTLALFAALALAGCASTGGGTVAEDKVVYHLTEGLV